MIKLSLMQAIVATVGDTGESALANQILAAWPHDPGTARFLRVSANALFTFTQAGRPYVLRFNHAGERSAERIQAEVAYLQYLAAAGVRVAQPLQSAAGRYVESVDTARGRFHAVVFEAVAGEQFELDALSLALFGQWGQALGKLHRAAQSYTGVGRPTWHEQVAWLMEHLPPGEHAARQTLAMLRAQLNALPADSRSVGLIHFDCELDNLIWAEQGPVLIDFDDSAWFWFAADIAYALRDLFGDDLTQIDLDSPPLRAFIAGYRTEKALAPEDIALLPVFLRFHHVITFAKLLRALDGARTDEPAWAAALRHKLEQKIQAYREQFIAYTR